MDFHGTYAIDALWVEGKRCKFWRQKVKVQGPGGITHSYVLQVAWAETYSTDMSHGVSFYTVFRKKHPLTFSVISPWNMLRFTQNFQGMFMSN